MVNVEFISYDGAYPDLCSGKLIISINGIRHFISDGLNSSKEVSLSVIPDYYADIHKEKGKWWSVDVPKELEQYKKEIEKVVNDNVQQGCCGGCI